VENRVRTSIYIFSKPFFLPCTGETHPAGTYRIDLEEELLEGLSFDAYRHVAMTMIPQRQTPGRALQIYQVDRKELTEAIAACGVSVDAAGHPAQAAI